MNLPDFTPLVDFFLPSRCGLCGLGATVRGLCASCRGEFLPWRQEEACRRCGDRLTPAECEGICAQCALKPPRFEAVSAGFWYEPPLDALIHRFKYGADLRLGRALAPAMAQTMLPPLAIDVLLPVPLAPRRRRETPHQARLHASARRENLRGAFAVERARAIAGRRVGVVDDVLTTGATLNALAEVLLESGAAAVQGIVLARAASPVRLTG